MFTKVSSYFRGIDRSEARAYWLDLSIPTVREYVKEQFRSITWDNERTMHKVYASYDTVSGISTACGDMTNYCYDFYAMLSDAEIAVR